MTISNKKLTIILFLLIAVFIIALFIPSEEVYADMGPKPTIQVKVDGLPESKYIVSIITNQSSPGGGGEIYKFDIHYMAREDQLFIKRLRKEEVQYEFLGPILNYSLTTSVDYFWKYYAPSKFAIVIYDVDNDILYMSEECQKYVYNKVYSIKYEDFEPINENTYTFSTNGIIVYAPLGDNSIGGSIAVNVSMFILRMVLTIAIELLIALCFKFTKESYKVIAITNAITQLVLNAVIILWGLFSGALFGPFVGLIIGEVIVFIVEPIVYKKKCLREDGTKKYIVLYAILANFITLAAGFGLNILEIYLLS
ncbi:MAG: hypothetical protein E7338_00525 [Clostridiales bacterium]|nr:hypothetical protein [Clostridiales bacterium]